MTRTGPTTVHELNEDAGRTAPWRWVKIVLLSLVLMFTMGIGFGFTAAHLDRGGEFGLVPLSILGGVALVAAGSAWLLIRILRRPAGGDPLTAKERLNRNILIVCGALGGLIGVLLTFAEGSGLIENNVVFSNEPLSPGFAIALIVLTGIVTPALSFYWHHRAIDEQEADAYKTGALYGLYVFMIGAPVWWFAWRGGFAPAPDGITIYFATILVVLAVWMWKKYR